MDNQNKIIEDLKKDIISLKIRLKRIEEFLLNFPKINDYLHETIREDELDPLFEDAKRLLQNRDEISASYIQRMLKIGYARAARLLDILVQAKLVEQGVGAKPAKVIKENL